jgi:hypothetical protein
LRTTDKSVQHAAGSIRASVNTYMALLCMPTDIPPPGKCNIERRQNPE